MQYPKRDFVIDMLVGHNPAGVRISENEVRFGEHTVITVGWFGDATLERCGEHRYLDLDSLFDLCDPYGLKRKRFDALGQQPVVEAIEWSCGHEYPCHCA